MAADGKPKPAGEPAAAPGSNVHDLAADRFTRAMTPAMRRRVMARARIIDQVLDGEDEDDPA